MIFVVMALGIVLILNISQEVRAAGSWYVSPIGSDAYSCSTTTQPCATINGAIAKAANGDLIYVAVGNYTGSSSSPVVELNKILTLSGGWNANFTVQSGFSTIDGSNATYGIRVTNSVTATVQSFIIENCTSNGIFSTQSFLTVEHSAIRNNGRGLYVNGGKLILTQSAITGNEDEADGGGGILCLNGTLVVNNSTISNNSTTAGHGGGIFASNSIVEINSSTIAGNMVDSDMGRGGGIDNAAGTVTLKNSIVAGNWASWFGSDCYGEISSAGYNLIGNNWGCYFLVSSGDQLNVDPLLAPLEGQPAFYRLQPGSPAISAANPSGCLDHRGELLITDQRGVPRVGRCDIGAYEAVLTVKAQAEGTIYPNRMVTYTLTIDNDDKSADLYGVRLTDTFASKLAYVPDSLAATHGIAEGHEKYITWQGTVFSNTTTVITFQTFIAPGLGGGGILTNIALAQWENAYFTTTVDIDLRDRTYIPTVLRDYYFTDPNYFDDFSSANSGWPIVDNGFVRTGYSNGEYRILARKGGSLYLSRAPIHGLRGYTLETDMRWNKTVGNSYGLIFDIRGDFEYYYVFDLNAETQKWQFYRYTSTGVIKYVTPTVSTVIKSGNAVNHLKVIRNSGWIWLYINDTHMPGSPFPDMSPNLQPSDIGVEAGGYPLASDADARFDNFQVSPPEKSMPFP